MRTRTSKSTSSTHAWRAFFRAGRAIVELTAASTDALTSGDDARAERLSHAIRREQRALARAERVLGRIDRETRAGTLPSTRALVGNGGAA